MVIIDVCGGLGNQMFQYALYCELKVMGKDVKLSLRHFEDVESGKRKSIPSHGRKYLLDLVFQVDKRIATRKEIEKFGSVGTNYVSRILLKLDCRKKTHYLEEKMQPVTKQKILSIENGFLEGYWQDFSLFDDAYDMIRSQFVFAQELTGRNLEIAHQICSSQSVSIHVRRGDYLKSSLYAQLGEEYYLNAIKYINLHVNNPEFFCFSDDIEWCKELLRDYPVHYIDWNTAEKSFFDMRLMSMCKHNIVANSSFSVWSAWLNNNENKIVIRPQRYYLKEDSGYHWPYEWLTC